MSPPISLPTLAERFCTVRSFTEHLAAPLSPEDQAVQTMADVSPTSWHRAHTTWFFETFVLSPNVSGYRPVDDRYKYLFNSYYEALGARQARPERGFITRPGSAGVGRYRTEVDRRMLELLSTEVPPDLEDLITLGLHHEQQHQELLMMDIKHVLSRHPFDEAYSQRTVGAGADPGPAGWVDFEGGTVDVGFAGAGFCFDNELPRHRQLVHPFRLADRLVTAGEWMDFQADDGYRRAELWLSDGWGSVQAEGWEAPLYWHRHGDGDSWRVHTLTGRRPVDPAEPVCHVSLYEADAFARWAGARLPTEAEWEVAAGTVPLDTATFDADRLHPAPAGRPTGSLRQMYGAAWEWTASSYAPYRGYRPAPGAVGEYNGKFMVNQMVLRGGCCITPNGHIRPSYRNFFRAADRWPVTGVRLAADS